MNKILLVDVDSKIPNIALMKLSTYYKSQNYIVDFIKCNISYYPTRSKILKKINGIEYDKIFISVIFTTTLEKFKICFSNDNIEIGGTGYSLDKKLPDYIQQSVCDYSLYPDNNIAYGFISRGCIRNCSFCFVPKKEGKLYQEHNINDIIQPQLFKQTKFLDNNFLALPNHKDILKELVNKKIRYQFNQGLDIRLIDDENAELLSKSNYIPEYMFSFDNIAYKSIINKKLLILKKYLNKDWQIKFFIYCHPDMNIENDVMYRINWCKDNQVLPYLMRDLSCWQSPNKKLYNQLTRWCNQPNMFKKMTFEEFNK